MTSNEETQVIPAITAINKETADKEKERKQRQVFSLMIAFIGFLSILILFLVGFAAIDAAREDKIKERLGRECISIGGVWHEGSCFYSHPKWEK